MPNEVRHPKSVVAGGCNSKDINHCNTNLVGIAFCQQFGNPANNGLSLERNLNE
jgi:hypothetical protein